MAEYIDREKTLSTLENTAKYYEMPNADEWTKGIRYGLIHGVDNIVDNVPTADVIERSKIDEAIEDSYKKGLTDAWECARKIGNNSQLGLKEMGFDFSELGTYYNPSWWVVFNYDVFKVLEILKRNIGE